MEAILISIITAVIYGLMIFTQKSLDGGVKFEMPKLARTVIVGVIVGGVASFKGYDLTSENYQAYVAANAGVIAIFEPLIITLQKMIKK